MMHRSPSCLCVLAQSGHHKLVGNPSKPIDPNQIGFSTGLILGANRFRASAKSGLRWSFIKLMPVLDPDGRRVVEVLGIILETQNGALLHRLPPW